MRQVYNFFIWFTILVGLSCAANAATLLPNGKQQFVDANGVPYVGGSVYFYAPSTTTAKDTWQDSGQVTLNANPVVLDSAGRAIIYGVGTYRQILKDSLGNTIWDQLTADTSSGTVIWGGLAAGTANAIILNQGSFTGADGQILSFLAGANNTTATTVTISGSTIPLRRDTSAGPVALTGGEILTNNVVMMVYDLTAGTFHLVNSQVLAPTSITTATGTITTGTITTLTSTNATITNSALSGTLAYTGVISPTQLVASTNNWNPTNLQSAIVIRMDASTAINLTGLTAPTTNASGHQIVLLNVGTGTVTLTANDASSTAANRFSMPYDVALLQNQSATFIYDTTSSIWRLGSMANSSANYQAFTVSGTWTKPGGFSATARVNAMCWGAGGGGGSNVNGGGGGGGSAVLYETTLGSLGSTVTVTVATAPAVDTVGGNTTFGAVFTAYGGGPGAAGTGNSGSGGGLYAAGANNAAGGAPLGGAVGAPGGDSIYGGGGSSGSTGANSVWGGGSGGTSNNPGGRSFYGGGGGGGSVTGTGGSSVVGGSGGGNGVAGVAPGGGGGRNAIGSRGECRVWVFAA